MQTLFVLLLWEWPRWHHTLRSVASLLPVRRLQPSMWSWFRTQRSAAQRIASLISERAKPPLVGVHRSTAAGGLALAPYGHLQTTEHGRRGSNLNPAGCYELIVSLFYFQLWEQCDKHHEAVNLFTGQQVLVPAAFCTCERQTFGKCPDFRDNLSNVCLDLLVWSISRVNVEEVGFMPYTAASHQGAIKMICPHVGCLYVQPMLWPL